MTAALYQVQSVAVEVKSPFKQAGEFEVLLYESSDKTLLHSMSPTARYMYKHVRDIASPHACPWLACTYIHVCTCMYTHKLSY